MGCVLRRYQGGAVCYVLKCMTRLRDVYWRWFVIQVMVESFKVFFDWSMLNGE